MHNGVAIKPITTNYKEYKVDIITEDLIKRIEKLEKQLLSAEEVILHNWKRLNRIQDKPEGYKEFLEFKKRKNKSNSA